MEHLPRVLPPSLLLVKMASRLLLFGRRAHSFEGVVWRRAAVLWLVVVTWRPWRRQLRGERGAGDWSMGLHAAGGQGELHESFAERPNVSLLQILQPIILVHPPCPAHSLNRRATLSAYLGIGDPGDVEGRAHRGGVRRLLGLIVLLLRRRMPTEILGLHFGFFVRREVLRVRALPLATTTPNAASSCSSTSRP